MEELTDRVSVCLEVLVLGSAFRLGAHLYGTIERERKRKRVKKDMERTAVSLQENRNSTENQ